MSWGQRIILTLAIVLNIAVCLSKGTDNFGDPFASIGLLVVLNIFVLPLTALGWVLFDERTWRHLKGSLAPGTSLTKYGVKDTGRLIEGLRYGNRHTRAMTQETLIPLLACLSVTDASRFEPHHLEILHTEIQQGMVRKDSVFLLAALAALEKIGDETTITFLHIYFSTAHPSHRSKAPEWTTVQEAARNCLDVLESREYSEARTLVRASTSPFRTEALLRPAGSGKSEEPETLLRPVNAGNESKSDSGQASR